jgi:hypothetical protein
MPIPLSKFVNIVSGVGAGNNVAVRQLIGMIFTENVMVDPLSPLVFTGGATAALAAIGTYFGTSSEEYARAALYFSYISPSIRAPQSIAYGRYANSVSPASIFGADLPFSLTTLKLVIAGVVAFNFGDTPALVTAGSFVVGRQYTITSVGTTDFTLVGASASTVGIQFIATGVGTGTGVADYQGVVTVGSFNLSAATNLGGAGGVASIVQTALQLSADTRLSAATCTYNAVTSSFDFVANTSGVTLSPFNVVQIGSGLTDLSLQLGWYTSQGALNISSSPAVSPVQSVTTANSISNNFGSFCFTNPTKLTLAQIEAVATYNADLNVVFQYCLLVTPETYASVSAALASTAGVAMTYELDTLNQYPEMIPMAIMAATDYTQRNGVQNYMYRQIPGITPSVTGNSTDPVSYTTLDAALVNYYGVTQEAGQNIAFYQNGVLTGLATSPQAMNIFANEQWFKSYVASALLSLQLSLPQISANKIGVGQILSVLQNAINTALFNGVISIGKTLTTIQQLYITEETGDALAWVQVQNSGYWVAVKIVQSVVNGQTVYEADYTIIYAKNDAVLSINGTHTLI